MTQPPPIRRELAAVVFLFLGVFCILSYFNTDGSFVAFFSNLIKGLLGWGFWLTAPAFLLVAFILGFHRGDRSLSAFSPRSCCRSSSPPSATCCFIK